MFQYFQSTNPKKMNRELVTKYFSVLFFLSVNVYASEESQPTNNSQCPTFPTFIAKLTTEVPDLGGGIIFDENDAPLEQLGTSECPKTSATQCDKLLYMSFMFALMDMSPQKFRRPGLSAFITNVFAEDSSLGDKCSAENVEYNGNNIRKQFDLSTRFCRSSDPVGFSLGQQAKIVLSDGKCDTSDAALERLKDVIVSQNQNLAKQHPSYTSKFTPIVIRMYRYNTKGNSDEDGYLYRGRGFIQLTGKASYQTCQNSITGAAIYLRSNPIIAKRVSAITRIDWFLLDVVKKPELVSQNRFVAAFCAASYWNSYVAESELVWTINKDNTNDTFHKVVKSINKKDSKAAERYPEFKKWCNVIQCNKNFPVNLNFEQGFSTLMKYSRNITSKSKG
jgi:predicted chitinase